MSVVNRNRFIDYFFVCGIDDTLESYSDNAVDTADVFRKQFKAKTLQRYPEENWEDAPLPPHVWMFCFPRGVQLQRQSSQPTFFIFALTEIDGAKFYGAALCYYRKIPPSQKQKLSKTLGKATNQTVYAPTCICLLSHFPFFSVLRHCLREVYWCVHSKKSQVPIERLISRIINDLPLPPRGKVRVRVKQAVWPDGSAGYGRRILANNSDDASDESYLERIMANENAKKVLNDGLYYHRPAMRHFELCDFPIRTLFDCLGVAGVLQLHAALLAESKVIFVSHQPSLLTVACETVVALLYPFEWHYVMLPLLPHSLLDLLQAPTPYVMGLHPSFLSDVSHEIDANEVVIADLDRGTITCPVELHMPPALTSIVSRELVKVLYPQVAQLDLAFDTSYDVAPQRPVNPVDTSNNNSDDDSSSSDSNASTSNDTEAEKAFKKRAAAFKRDYDATLHAGKTPTLGLAQREREDETAVRGVFLALFVALLHDYRAYIQYIRRYPTPVAVFNKALCLRDNTFAARFLADFVDTQAFSVFLHQRHTVPRNLFDVATNEATALLKQLDEQQHRDAGAGGDDPFDDAHESSAARLPPAIALLRNGLIERLLQLPCLASDVCETYVVPAPQLHDFGSATTFDYADDDAPAFPVFDTSRFVPLRSPDVDMNPLAYLSLNQDEDEKPANGDLTRYRRVALALQRRAATTLQAEAAAAQATRSSNALLLNDGALPGKSAVSRHLAATRDRRASDPGDQKAALLVADAVDDAHDTADEPSNDGTADETPAEEKRRRKRKKRAAQMLKKEATFIEAGDAAQGFIDAFFRNLFENKPLEHEELALLQHLLRVERERATFVERLRKHKTAVSGESPLELTDSSFTLLVDVLRAALREAHAVADFQTPLDVLGVGAAFYRVRDGPEFLYSALRALPVWHNTYFWEFAVFSRIERHKLEWLPAEILDEDRAWHDIEPDRQALIVSSERDVVSRVLTEYAQHMLHMGVAGERARALVSQMSSLASLSSEQRQELLSLISNIERVMHADVARGGAASSGGDAVGLTSSGAAAANGDTNGGSVAGGAGGVGAGAGASNGVLMSGSGSSAAGVGGGGANAALFGDATFDKSDDMRAVVGVLSGASAKRRLGGDNYHDDAAEADQSQVKDMYQRLIELQRKGRRSSASSASQQGTSAAGATRRARKGTVDGAAPASFGASSSTEQRKNCQVTTLHGHAQPVETIAASRSFIASGAKDGSLVLWRSKDGSVAGNLVGHTDRISALSFADANTLCSGSYDKSVRVWDASSATLRFVLLEHTGSVCAIDSHGDRSLLVSGSYDHTIKLWDLRKLAPSTTTLTAHTGALIACKFDKSGRTMVSTSRDTTIKVWDLRKKPKCLYTLKGHIDWVKCFQFDSKRLVSSSYDGTIKLWDLKSGKCIRTLSGHRGAVNCLKYDADGTLLITGGADGTLKQWDLKSGQLLRTFQGHEGDVECLEVTDRLFSGSADGTVRTWPLNSLDATVSSSMVLRGHGDAVVALRAVRDEHLDDDDELLPPRRVVSASSDGTCRLWRVAATGAPTDTALLKKSKSTKKGAATWAFVKTK